MATGNEVNSERDHATFVVRISHDETDGVSGVVICVRTGDRKAFRGVDGAERALAQMIARDFAPATGSHEHRLRPGDIGFASDGAT